MPGSSPALLAPRAYWYLRHGETDWNARGLSQGRSDIPLNEKGLAQAEAAGRAIGEITREAPIGLIVSSPLIRAARTAQIASQHMAQDAGEVLPVTYDDDLREVSFGVQEGQPMGDWYDAWIAGDYTPEGAEPFAELRARAIAAVDRATGAATALGRGPALIVAHGALFRALRSAMGLRANERLPNAVPMWCDPNDGAWTLSVHAA